MTENPGNLGQTLFWFEILGRFLEEEPGGAENRHQSDWIHVLLVEWCQNALRTDIVIKESEEASLYRLHGYWPPLCSKNDCNMHCNQYLAMVLARYCLGLSFFYDDGSSTPAGMEPIVEETVASSAFAGRNEQESLAAVPTNGGGVVSSPSYAPPPPSSMDDFVSDDHRYEPPPSWGGASPSYAPSPSPILNHPHNTASSSSGNNHRRPTSPSPFGAGRNVLRREAFVREPVDNVTPDTRARHDRESFRDHACLTSPRMSPGDYRSSSAERRARQVSKSHSSEWGVPPLTPLPPPTLLFSRGQHARGHDGNSLGERRFDLHRWHRGNVSNNEADGRNVQPSQLYGESFRHNNDNNDNDNNNHGHDRPEYGRGARNASPSRHVDGSRNYGDVYKMYPVENGQRNHRAQPSNYRPPPVASKRGRNRHRRSSASTWNTNKDDYNPHHQKQQHQRQQQLDYRRPAAHSKRRTDLPVVAPGCEPASVKSPWNADKNHYITQRKRQEQEQRPDYQGPSSSLSNRPADASVVAQGLEPKARRLSQSTELECMPLDDSDGVQVPSYLM
jgi:hypothetical protein